ncbi:MAG TPA: Arm DNA-binding domain-containing protein, partial [Caldimonas sp.]|nr:Arm DNA-binding domain-containing protein [Caldimonas sp.]
MAKLTVKGIEALKPRASGSYRVTIDRGLYLRVATDGTKTWFVRYRIGDRQIQARLSRPFSGRGGDGHLSLAQALAENARIQSLARDGIDFQVQREEAARAAADARRARTVSVASLRDLFEAWIADGVSRKDDNAELRRA